MVFHNSVQRCHYNLISNRYFKSLPEGEGVNLAIVKRSDDVTKTKVVKLWNSLA